MTEGVRLPPAARRAEGWEPTEVRAGSVADAREVLRGRTPLVLTGAGVSTASGIPDYRGRGATSRLPMTFQQLVASDDMRRRYWARAHVGWSRMTAAEPNAAHRVLAAAERAGDLGGVITQNVDGLHERAGQPTCVALHGRIHDVICLDCETVTPRSRLHARLVALNPGYAERAADIAPDGDALIDDTADFVLADCERCGGRLKPDVVFFGENVPRRRVEHCRALVDAADALVVAGSSLQVMSGLRFVRQTARLERPIVIVNHGRTRGDDLATVKVDADVASTLMELLGPC